jgi:hypothetical protein
MPLNSLSPDVSAIIDELKRRVEHADANPLVGKNGDQNPITIWHAEMAPLLRSAPFSDEETWGYLHKEFARQQGTISGNYSGAWIRALVGAVKGE